MKKQKLVKKSSKYENIMAILLLIGFFCLTMGSLMLGLWVHEKLVLGFERDCQPFLDADKPEREWPGVCQDFSKYHLMTAGVIGLWMMSGILMAAFIFSVSKIDL